MWNCRWLLYVIVLGLAARRTSSVNDQSHGKDNSPKRRGSEIAIRSMNTNTEGKKNPQDDSSANNNDREDNFPSGSLNRTVTGLGADASNSSNDTTKVKRSHEQSHSKRHFRRSKLYRKEGRTKVVRGGLNKNNSTKGNPSPSGATAGILSKELFRNNLTRNSDSRKLKLSELTSITSSVSPSRSRDGFISTNSSSTRHSKSGTNNDALDSKLDELSSKTSDGSGWTDDSGNSSSSEAGSVVDEKSSSVELMSFNFDTAEAIHRSTSPTQTAATSFTTPRNSFSSTSTRTTTATVQESDRSIDAQKSSLLDPADSDRIDRDQSIQSGRGFADDDRMIYSVHTENNSRDFATHEPSTSVSPRNDSPSSAMGYYASKNASNESASTSADFERSADEYSYSLGSAEDSFDRISLARVIDALKNAGSEEILNRRSYSYTDSTQLSGSSEPSEDKIETAKRSPSLINPEEIRHSAESHPSSIGHDSIAFFSEDIDGPLKLTVPLSFASVENDRRQGSRRLVPKNATDLPRSSTEDYKDHFPLADIQIGKRYSEEKRLGTRVEGGIDPELKLGIHSSFNSSTERSRNEETVDTGDSLNLRPGSEATLSTIERSLSDSIKSEQSLTSSSSGNTAQNSTYQSKPETLSAGRRNRSNASSSATDDHRGAQSFSSTDDAVIPSENIEPVVRESSSESVDVGVETEETTTDADRVENFFAGFADPEIEHRNASSSSSSFDIFIPYVNSGEIVAKVPVEEFEESSSRREVEKLTTRPESLYLIEGFRFFKNNDEEASDEEEEEEIERRGTVFSDYSQTESYPQIEGIIPGLKVLDQIEFEAELPIKEEPLPADFQWKGNLDDRGEDLWSSNDNNERKDDEISRRTLSGPSKSPASKEVREIQYSAESVQQRMKNASAYRTLLFPTIYVLIGICIVAVGCSIWWGNAPSRRQRRLPKLRYFVQQKQEAWDAVV